MSEQRFEAEGVTTSGRVTSKKVETSRSRDSETHRVTETQSYYLSYVFDTKKGQRIEDRDTVEKERWGGLNLGDSIEIQYLPDRAEENRISRESSIVGGVLMCCFAVLGNIIGIASIILKSHQKGITPNNLNCFLPPRFVPLNYFKPPSRSKP